MAKDIKKFHQAAGRVISDPKMADALQELDTNPNVHNDAKTDAKGYLKKKGVQVPDEMTAAFKPDNWSIRICGWGYCVSIGPE